MKKFKLFLLVLPFVIMSCSSDDSSDPTPDNGGSNFAMTASINGVAFQANNPFGTNMYSSTNIYDYFPKADYIMLQARSGGIWGNPEINLWLKKTDIVVGTYPVGVVANNPNPTHYIDLIDNSVNTLEDTVDGVVKITEVNPSTKIVKGTFSFRTSEYADEANPVINYTVSNGTFRYQYLD